MAIILVSGHLGAGKTTICEKLSKILGYDNRYTGEIFNKMARENGLSKERFYKEMVAHPELEMEIDRQQEQLMLTQDNIIVQGRIAPFLRSKPGCQRIAMFFAVSDEEGARRQLKRPENAGRTFEQMLAISRERTEVERSRYRKLYPHIPDHLDQSRFDVVIDTTNLNEMQVLLEVLFKLRMLMF